MIIEYYAQKAAPTPCTEAQILVIQADGKGVPMILEETSAAPVRLGKGEKRGRKKEAVVTGVYTIAPAERTPEQVVSSYFDQTARAGERSKPQNKQIWATLDGKETALARLSQQVALRQGEHLQHQVALCDGCEALQSRIVAQFPDCVLVLDFIHANEYLWKVANSLLGETNERAHASLRGEGDTTSDSGLSFPESWTDSRKEQPLRCRVCRELYRKSIVRFKRWLMHFKKPPHWACCC